MGEYVEISAAMATIEQAYKELIANAEKFKNYSQALLKSDAKDEKAKVSLETYKQVIWERNVAIDQLKELGYGFGETTSDAIPRENIAKIKEVVKSYFLGDKSSSYDCLAEIEKLVNCKE